MSKQIIVLGKSSDGTQQNISVAFWYPASSGQASVAANSAWSGASAAENTAIGNGSVIEEVRSFSFPLGTPIAAMKSVFQQAWAERNAQINGVGPNPFYGVFFDGSTGWSA